MSPRANKEPVLKSVLRSSLARLRDLAGRGEKEQISVVLAVSGGMDSSAMLDAVVALAKESKGLELVVAHVDHGIREESSQDASFVEELVANYGLSFRLYQTVPPENCGSLEAWARTERYRFLEDCRAEAGAFAVLTAHHQNDQAETLLMRVLSGRLASDAHCIGNWDENTRRFRPMLAAKREDVESYVQEKGVPYVMDHTNSELYYTRNRIRHRLLPVLASDFNPSIVQTCAETAARLSQDEDLLWREAKKSFLAHEASCSVDYLSSLPEALFWRVCKLAAVEQLGELGEQLGYRALCRVSKVVAAKCRAVELGFGVRAELKKGSLFFSELDLDDVQSLELPTESLSVPGQVERCYLDGSKALISSFLVDESNLLKENVLRNKVSKGEPELQAEALFDYEQLLALSAAPLVLQIREKLEGDSIRVWKRGERKLKKLFQEQGLRLTLRRSLPIVELDAEVLWIPGVARSEEAPISERTSKVLKLVYRRSV